jgi:hypothetical protein
MKRVTTIILFACIIIRCNAQEIKEMSPTLGRLFNFDPETGALWDKADKILEEIHWKYDKLTTEQKKFFKQINYNYENEAAPGYWDAIGVGCSWYCGGGPDSVYASSTLYSVKNVYAATNAHDLNYSTAWVEGVKGDGIGEYLVYHFEAGRPRITDIIVANGYVKSEKAWTENSRVKKLKLYYNNKPIAILNLEDKRQEQSFHFTKPFGNKRDNHENLIKKNSWTLRFEILEVYPGDKYDDTAITEIYFDGLDVHCFAAGTKITMAYNSVKNIEQITEKDVISTFDFNTKSLQKAQVTKLIEVTHDNLIKLQFSDREIITTADHPFWTENKNWVAINPQKSNSDYKQTEKIKELKIGDKVFLPVENKFVELKSIEKIENKQKTYTIELKNSDNFIANGLLVKTEIIK